MFQRISSYYTPRNGSWESKGMSEETITTPSRAENSFNPEIIYNYGRGRIKFKGICLKQDSVSFIDRNAVNLYIWYKVDTWSRDLNTDFT